MATKVSQGRYKASVYLGTENGKRKYKVFYAPTADEADFLALEFKLKKKERYDPIKITVGDAIDDYINSKSNVLSPTTIQGYKRYRKLYFKKIMNEKVSNVTSIMLQNAINEEAILHSPKTVKNAYGIVLLGIQLYRPEFLPRVSVPKERPIQYDTPDGETLKRIFEASKGTFLELPILLSAWLSLRASEIVGLRWIDVYDDYIYVRNARVYAEGKSHDKGTKNTTSTRKIPLPEYIKELLDKTEHTSEYVCDITGNALSKSFVRMLKKNNIPHCRFHDLRHANASIMVMLGIPDRYAQIRGGWANGTTLSKRYQQTFADEEIRVAEKIDTYFDELMHTNIHTNESECVDI